MPPADPYAYVDPSWAPPAAPATRRSGWLPLLVVIMVTVLVAGGLFAAERIGGTAPTSTALDYLPADGAVAYQQREITIGTVSTTRQLVTESARLTGGGLMFGLDFTLGVAVRKALAPQAMEPSRFWRTTTTEIATPESSQQPVAVYRADGAVELVAESGPRSGATYTPALVELPAEVRPGDAWSGAGTVGTRLYRSEYRAEEAAGEGCLRVVGTLDELTSAGQPAATRAITKTWCLGRGVVDQRVVRGEVTTTTAQIGRPAVDRTLRTVTDPVSWSDPRTWRPRDYDVMSADATFGSGLMMGSSAQLPAVIAASGLMLRATSGDDVVAFTPKTVDKWVALWRMHPGGTLLSIQAFGDVVVVTTSRRQAVAYSDAGARLWTLDLDEIAFKPPVRVTEGRVALADASGTVRLVELLTGEVVWSTELGAEIRVPLAADSQTVVAFDRQGSTVALDAATGTRRWQTDLIGTSAVILGHTLVVRTDAATIEALDMSTGNRRWLAVDRGTLDAMAVFGDRVLVATQLRTLVLDEDGRQVGESLPAYQWLMVAGSMVVGFGASDTEIRGADLTVLRTLDTADITLRSNHGSPPVAYRQGVYVFGKDWTFTGWSDEP